MFFFKKTFDFQQYTESCVKYKHLSEFSPLLKKIEMDSENFYNHRINSKMSQRTNKALSKHEKEWSIYWFESIDRLPEKSQFRPKYYDLSGNVNMTTDILQKYPEKPWCWKSLSRNPNITFDFVLSNLDKSWDWQDLSRNESITIDHVLSHSELPWCWIFISSNPNITIETLLDNLEKPWDWSQLTGNYAFTKEQILEHPELPWDSDMLELLFGEPQEYKYKYEYENENEYEYEYEYENNETRHTYYDADASEYDAESETPRERSADVENWNLLDWEEASLDKELSIEFVRQHITGSWSWNALSYNKTLTFEFVLENINNPWNWNALSYHKNITMENIQQHPQLPWSWQMVFTNPNLTIEVIQENIHQKYITIPYDHPLKKSKEIYIREREREDNFRNLELIQRYNQTFPAELFGLVSEFL